jgi:hypothetical protein
MGEFAAALKRRLEGEYASLDAARSAAVGRRRRRRRLSEALLAEIENLRRIAADHGLHPGASRHAAHVAMSSAVSR